MDRHKPVTSGSRHILTSAALFFGGGGAVVAYSAAVSQPLWSVSAPWNLVIVFAAHSSKLRAPLPLESSLANAFAARRISPRLDLAILVLVGPAEALLLAAFGTRLRSLERLEAREQRSGWQAAPEEPWEEMGFRQALRLPEQEGAGQHRKHAAAPARKRAIGHLQYNRRFGRLVMLRCGTKSVNCVESCPLSRCRSKRPRAPAHFAPPAGKIVGSERSQNGERAQLAGSGDPLVHASQGLEQRKPRESASLQWRSAVHERPKRSRRFRISRLGSEKARADAEQQAAPLPQPFGCRFTPRKRLEQGHPPSSSCDSSAPLMPRGSSSLRPPCSRGSRGRNLAPSSSNRSRHHAIRIAPSAGCDVVATMSAKA